jgi:BirA family biotin operon repressor/biotin-[acetyl-CoA-carboxylase] ligase
MLVEHRPLTRAELLPQGARRRLGRQVYLHGMIDSTNAFLLREASSAGDGAVAWAEFQTAGRGQLGRQWESPRGSSILLSVLVVEPPDSPLISQAALLAAVAASEAIEQTTTCTPGIRWPNDLVLDRRKVGGVLAESCAVPGGRAVVIGVGINVYQQPGHFPRELVESATSLECASTQPIERAAVAAALLERLDTWLATTGESPASWTRLRTAWQARCVDVGTRVALAHNGRKYAGTALDIAENGDLIVQLVEGGRTVFAAATTTRHR